MGVRRTRKLKCLLRQTGFKCLDGTDLGGLNVSDLLVARSWEYIPKACGWQASLGFCRTQRWRDDFQCRCCVVVRVVPTLCGPHRWHPLPTHGNASRDGFAQRAEGTIRCSRPWSLGKTGELD